MTTLVQAIMDLAGIPISRVFNSIGSHFVMDLGELELERSEPNEAKNEALLKLGHPPQSEPNCNLVGWRTMVVQCPWTLVTPGGPVLSWDDDPIWPAVVAELLKLKGESIRAVEASDPGDVRLAFSGGASLRLYNDPNEVEWDDGWFVLGRDGFELSVGTDSDTSGGWRFRPDKDCESDTSPRWGTR